MTNITTLFDLSGKRVIIYCAGATGYQFYTLLTQKIENVDIIAFCDTFKTGIDTLTGAKIISPTELGSYNDAYIIIGLSDYLKPDQVELIRGVLNDNGVKPEKIISYTDIYSLIKEVFDEAEMDWQSYTEDIYDFNTNKVLIENLSGYIADDDKSVADLGAGNMNLKKYLSQNTKYYPVDYKRRCDETIVCDFNKNEFPDIFADVYVLCAILYYIDNPVDFLIKCAKHAQKKIIIALNSRDMTDQPFIENFVGFKNTMYFNEIDNILSKYNFIAVDDVVVKSVSRRFIVYKKIQEQES